MNVRPWSSLRAASSSGSAGWATATEKTDASWTPASASSPNMGLALSPRMEWCVLQWGHQKGEEGEPGSEQGSCSASTGPVPRREHLLLCCPRSLIPWVFLPGLPTGCLLSKARGHRTPLLRHQLLLIPFPGGTGWPLGSVTCHKRESPGKELQTPSPAHKPEVICRRLWTLSADWGA